MTNNINIAGTWAFALDAENRGIEERWYAKELESTVELPGSLDENGIGEAVVDRDIHQFNRLFKYVGAAWYQRDIQIEESGKIIELFLERCMWETKVWIDDCYIGEGESLCVPHIFDLTDSLNPGWHRLSIRVDNSRKYDIGHRSHAYSEDQQTVWNGIVGQIELRTYSQLRFEKVQIYADANSKQIKLTLDFDNRTGQAENARINIEPFLKSTKEGLRCTENQFDLNLPLGKSTHEITLDFLDQVRLWDEFNPELYTLKLELSSPTDSSEVIDSRQEDFGFREFKAEGPVFKINGRKVLLRGTHDGGCFPLTGYPSTKKEDWLRIFKIVQSYGLNHVRFHSYNPPEDAFFAADEIGIILQTELPLFSISAPHIGKDAARDQFLRRELDRILNAFGNHPSFCMMAMGNELMGDYNILDQWVEEAKVQDPRHLYATVSNNGLNQGPNGGPEASDEFYVSHNHMLEGQRNLRRCEDIFNIKPETVGDYDSTLKETNIPVVSHEVGQWEVYPSFDEISKYTGVLRATNFQVFKESLDEKGLLSYAEDFFKASGQLVARLYREEIERSLRTENYGGFQLLDIRDYHGQGSSTIGILDSFWDSKGFISPEEFRYSCAPRVILARLPKRVFTNDEKVTVEIDFANYGGADLEALEIHWSLKTTEDELLLNNKLGTNSVKDGELHKVGSIDLDFTSVRQAQKVILYLEAGTIKNAYELWVYPQEQLEEGRSGEESDVMMSDTWDESLEEALQTGKTVIFSVKNSIASEGMRFSPPFWNTLLFSGQPKSMGLFCQPEHPVFKDFPTEFHNNWQWFDLLNKSRAIDLSDYEGEFSQIIHCIDHPVRNAKMSFLFETKVGNGKLLCCGLNLSDESSPVTQQFKKCLKEYAQSFDPQGQSSLQQIRDILKNSPSNWLSTHIKTITADSQAWDSPVENIIDGESVTCWKSSRGKAYPHEIKIELEEEIVIWGARYLGRQDGMKAGWIKDYEIYISTDPDDLGEAAMSGCFEESNEVQIVRPKLTDDGFNVTRSKKGRYIVFKILSSYDGGSSDAGGTIGSVAEFDLITEKF